MQSSLDIRLLRYTVLYMAIGLAMHSGRFHFREETGKGSGRELRGEGEWSGREETG